MTDVINQITMNIYDKQTTRDRQYATWVCKAPTFQTILRMQGEGTWTLLENQISLWDVSAIYVCQSTEVSLMVSWKNLSIHCLCIVV